VLNVQAPEWLQFKESIANLIVNALQTEITVEIKTDEGKINEQRQLGVHILLSKYEGSTDEALMVPIYNSYTIPPEITQAFKDASAAKAGMKAAWKESHPETKSLGKVKQFAKGKSTFDPATVNKEQVMDLVNDEDEY
jgi:hypothetical protein